MKWKKNLEITQFKSHGSIITTDYIWCFHNIAKIFSSVVVFKNLSIATLKLLLLVSFTSLAAKAKGNGIHNLSY